VRARDRETAALAVARAALDQLACRRDLREGPRRVGLSLQGRRQAREHRRLLSLTDAQHGGGETLSWQGVERPERVAEAEGHQHRRSWISITGVPVAPARPTSCASSNHNHCLSCVKNGDRAGHGRCHPSDDTFFSVARNIMRIRRPESRSTRLLHAKHEAQRAVPHPCAQRGHRHRGQGRAVAVACPCASPL
jgi:hypothetical protein